LAAGRWSLVVGAAERVTTKPRISPVVVVRLAKHRLRCGFEAENKVGLEADQARAVCPQGSIRYPILFLRYPESLVQRGFPKVDMTKILISKILEPKSREQRT
jgi:hypothetical protein